MAFIKVTGSSGGTFYINADHICEIMHYDRKELPDCKSCVVIKGVTGLFSEYVKETPEDILKQL